MLAQLCEKMVLNTHRLILTGMCPVLALSLPLWLPSLFCSLAKPWGSSVVVSFLSDLLMLRRGIPLQEH